MMPYIQIIFPSYSVMASVGLFVSLCLIILRNKRFGYEFTHILQLFIVTGICLLLGGKILFIITKIPDMIQSRSLQYIIQTIATSGIVFYGGLFGAFAGTIMFARFKKMDVNRLFNFLVPGFLAFHIFGRIGCFFAGCCYGIEASWGIAMASDPDVLRVPVQLIEAFCDILILIGVLKYEKRMVQAQRNYSLIEIYLVSYAICRFALEFLRGDVIRGVWVLGLSTSQIISVAIIIVLVFRRICVRRKAKEIDLMEISQ